MQNTRRGQVAMEYLATYGWAILAIFVVLAFLVGSGIFNPNRFASEECVFSPNLPCGSFYLVKVPGANNNDALGMNFNLTNAMGFPIYIQSVSYRLNNDPQVHVCPPTDCGVVLKQGQTTNWIGSSSNAPFNIPAVGKVTADIRRVYINVTFRNCQDLPSGILAGDCADPNTNANYPWHVVSGRMTAFVRGT